MNPSPAWVTLPENRVLLDSIEKKQLVLDIRPAQNRASASNDASPRKLPSWMSYSPISDTPNYHRKYLDYIPENIPAIDHSLSRECCRNEVIVVGQSVVHIVSCLSRIKPSPKQPMKFFRVDHSFPNLVAYRIIDQHFSW